MRKNPEKSGFPTIFSFTPGLPIPYHLVANAGSGAIRAASGNASYQRENQKKGELWQQQR
jgi:hypothetical protein